MIITEIFIKSFWRILTILVFVLVCLPLTAFSDALSPANPDNLIQIVEASIEPCKEVNKYADREQKNATEALIRLLKSQRDKRVQKCVAEALAAVDKENSINILINSLNDPDLLAASRAAFALGVIKDRRAVSYLLPALLESIIPCPAAEALGMIKDPDTMEPLIKAANHEKRSVRGCAVQALALYGDPRACETLTNVFMTDSDKGVRSGARRAKETIGCPSSGKQGSKYAMGDEHCDLIQRLIDISTPLLENTADSREWQKSPEWENITAEILSKDNELTRTPEEEKDFMMRFSIYSLITDWGKNVAAYRSTPESQTIAQKAMNSTILNTVQDKTEQLNQLCPNLKIPDYETLAY